MSQSSTVQRLAVVAFSSLLAGAGAAWAATPTATDPSQDSAATPAEADQARLPTAEDTHRTGPQQSDAGSGAVPETPETLSPEARREQLGGSSAQRMEQGRNEVQENSAGTQKDEAGHGSSGETGHTRP